MDLNHLTPNKERKMAMVLLLTHKIQEYNNRPTTIEALSAVDQRISTRVGIQPRLPSYVGIVTTYFKRTTVRFGLATLSHPLGDDVSFSLNRLDLTKQYTVHLTKAYYQSYLWTHPLFGNEGKNHPIDIPIYLTEGADNTNINVMPYLERENNYKRKYRRERRAWDTARSYR